MPRPQHGMHRVCVCVKPAVLVMCTQPKQSTSVLAHGQPTHMDEMHHTLVQPSCLTTCAALTTHPPSPGL